MFFPKPLISHPRSTKNSPFSRRQPVLMRTKRGGGREGEEGGEGEEEKGGILNMNMHRTCYLKQQLAKKTQTNTTLKGLNNSR